MPRLNPAFPLMTDLEMIGIDPDESHRLHHLLISAATSGESTRVNRALAAVRIAMGADTLSEIEADGQVIAIFVDTGDVGEPTIIYDVEAGDFVFSTEEEWTEEWQGGGKRTKTRHARGSIYPSKRANPHRRPKDRDQLLGIHKAIIRVVSDRFLPKKLKGGSEYRMEFVNGNFKFFAPKGRKLIVEIKGSELNHLQMSPGVDTPIEVLERQVASPDKQVWIERYWGKYRVPGPDDTEAQAYYTNDKEDAASTAKQIWGDDVEIKFRSGRHKENPFTANPANLTHKGERMYEDVKRGYELKGDRRAKEIAARTVYARAREGTPGLVKKKGQR